MHPSFITREKMEKKVLIVSFLCSLALIALPAAATQGCGPNSSNGPNAVRNWYKNLPRMQPKISEFHFYLHDIVSGPNPTNVPIAVANFTSSTNFGLIAAIDDALTSGPSLDSGVVGRAQGLFGSTSLNWIGYHMSFNIIFTAGKYNGSTLSLVGHNPFMDEYRELPVTGGSGAFRLAQGTAVLNTMTMNQTSGDAVVEYHVMVLHY